MIISALDIIQGAYGLLGIWDGTSALTAFETQTALACLNDMIDSWGLEQLSIYTNLIYEFPFAPGVYSYQLGLPAGQFSFSAAGTTLTILTANATPAVGQTFVAQGVAPNTTLLSGSGNTWTLSQPVANNIASGLGGLCDYGISPTGLPGFNWAIPRPARIERISARYYSGSSQPYEIPLSMIDVEHWQAIPVKDTASTYPLSVYNDDSFPYMNLSFWPVPNGPANCVVYCWDPLSELANLTDLVELPTGFNRAFKYNLAIEIAPYFEREPSATIQKIAMQSKHNIANINQETPELHYSPLFGGRKSSALQLALASRGGIVL